MDNDNAKAELFALLTDPDKRTADNAAWVMSHFTKEQQTWLYDKQDLLIEEAMSTDSRWYCFTLAEIFLAAAAGSGGRSSGGSSGRSSGGGGSSGSQSALSGLRKGLKDIKKRY